MWEGEGKERSLGTEGGEVALEERFAWESSPAVRWLFTCCSLAVRWLLLGS